MERDFERFLGGPTQALPTRMHITLHSTRHIVLNRNAYERFGSPAAVRLYYSARRDSIGIERTSPNFNDAFPVISNGASGWRINAATFCRHFNISVDTTVKFLAPEFNGDTLLLRLAETVGVARPRRRGKKVKSEK